MRTAKPELARFRRTLRADQTDCERRLWHRLRDRKLGGFKFVRQETIGRYVADFCCREVRLVIELDGGPHADSERLRDAFLADQGYQVLRFWNSDVTEHPDTVLDTILAALPPSPRARGEGRRDPVVGAASPQGVGEGVAPEETRPEPPPHPRLPPRSADDEVGRALSPQAGRGEMLA